MGKHNSTQILLIFVIMVVKKRNIGLFFLLICIIFNGVVHSQNRVGEWKSYTSTLDVRQSIELDGKIISATSGGILIFDRKSESFDVLTNIEGLVETDLSAIAKDPYGYLWLGSSSPRGIVQIYDIEKRSSVKSFDLELSEITAITTTDSTVFVAYSQNLNWGIMEFIFQNDEFIYRQIFNPSEERLDYIYDLVVRGDSLYAATDKGLFVGDYRQFILNYPQNWNIISDLEIKRLKVIGLETVVVTNHKAWSVTNILTPISNNYTGLKDITMTSDSILYGITKSKLIRFNNGGSVDSVWSVGANIHYLNVLSDNNLLLTTDRGLAIWDITVEEFQRFIPNTLVTNLYTALTVLKDGRLVAAGKKGISILSDLGWYNFIPSNDTSVFHDFSDENYHSFVADTVQYKSNRIWSVIYRSDGRILASIQGVLPGTNDAGEPIGGGVISFDLNDPSDFIVYDTTDGNIEPCCDDGYQNVRGLYLDNDQNLWILNYGSQNIDKIITVLKSNGDWIHIPQTGIGGPPTRLEDPTNMVITQREFVLIGGSKDNGLFAFSLNEDTDGDGILDLTDSILVTWHYFSEFEDELADDTIWDLVESEKDIVWILTSKGLQRLTFNSQFTQVTPYFFTYFAGVSFGEGSRLRLDIRGNLWASSVTNGVYVLLANSTPWPDWDGFRHANSNLLSDDVTDIAIDNSRGVAYIATSKGINVLKIPFAEPKKSYSHVVTFPSPYRIPNRSPMVIDGLVDNSMVKIMTLSGKVLRELSASFISMNSYQAFWNGKTNDGEYVGTGVYLVGIYSESGESLVTKIAVIRK